jgi:glycosyltransferase involved in cell wall biosynthesis
MKPFLTVIIPTLNEEKFLPKLLKDLVNQKEKDFEVIIPDGYSQDKTEDCVQSFKKNLNLQFFSTRLKNVAAQRNHGAEKASGDYLVFLDADARIGPTFLKRIKNSIKKNKGLLFLPYLIPDKDYKAYKTLFDLGNMFVEFSQNMPKKFSMGGTIIIESNFFKRIGGFDETLFISEDHELIQRAAGWGVHAKFIKEARASFSLRRMKKEGQLKFFYKYFIAASSRLFINEEIKNKVFEYEMGGQVYTGSKEKKKEEFFNHYYNQIRKLLRKLLLD